MAPSQDGDARRLRAAKITALVASSFALSACAATRTKNASPAVSVLPNAAPPSAATPAPATKVTKAKTDYTLLIDDIQGLALLREERLAAQQILAGWARSRGFRVADPEQAARVLDRARAGLHPRTGESCGRPIPRTDAKDRYHRDLGADADLQAAIECDEKIDSCKLRISVYTSFSFDGESVLDESAPYAMTRPYAQALPQALASLTTVKDDGSLNGILGGLSGGQVTAEPEQFTYSMRPALAIDQKNGTHFERALRFSDGDTAARACFGIHGGYSEVLATVDKAGRFSHCEALETDDAASRCACAAIMKTARTAAAVRNTRAVVTLSLRPADVVTPWKAVVWASTNTHVDQYRDARGEWKFRPRVSDTSIEGYRPPENHALAACFADAKERSLLPALVTIGFDEKGKATSVSVRETGKHAYSSQQRACVEQAFLASQAPCPAVPSATSHLELEITVRPTGEEMSKPFD